ncbi:MAG TPA: EAL domain-containing protein [Gemmatimonadota bacterium]|nr:EAL domain-containing protein [Gemmatimonadota bacterium]
MEPADPSAGQHRDAYLRDAIDHAAEGVALLDERGHLVYVNPSYARTLGYEDAGELSGVHWSALYPEDEAARLRREAGAALADRGSWRGSAQGRRRDGDRVPLELSLSRLPRGHVLCLASDASGRLAHERRLERLAYRDPLTGLPNRRLLRARAEQALALARRGGGEVGLIYLDLDGFKQVNDRLGHLVGDRVLKEVAERIASAVREADTAARIGGDEFAILLSEIEGETGALQAADRVQASLAPPIQIEDDTLFVAASMGIALFPTWAESFDEMLEQADLALYGDGRTKAVGVRIHRGESPEPSWLAEILPELHDALLHYRLALHFQPVRDLSTGRRIGAEALVRWPHPRLGLLSASKFVPLIGEPELARRLDRWVLASAVIQLRALQRAGSDLWVAAHLSDSAALDPDLVAYVERTLAAAADVESRRLVLEVPVGTALKEPTTVADRLTALRETGVGLVVDGLATGHASMGFLRDLPTCAVNLERAFIQGIGREPFEEDVLRTVIELAHAMDLKVRAKGIERETQREWLTAAGCDHGQGYLLGWVVPADELEG